MLKRRHVVILATMVSAVSVAGLMASGCGGDDSNTTSADSGADQSAADTGLADSAASSKDTGAADTSVADTGAADSAVADSGVADTSVADTGVVVDSGAADSGAADTGTGDGGSVDSGHDSGPVDSGSADSQADTGSADTGADAAQDGAADASDAGDGAVACTTSLGELDDAGGVKLLFGFDDPTTNVAGWIRESDNDSADSGVGAATTVAYDAVHGHTCPGSIAATLPFTQFGTLVQSGLQYNFAGGAVISNWTGATKLHFWVRVAAPAGAPALDYTTLNGVSSYAQWNGYGVTAGTASDVTGATLSDGAFHEVVITLDNPAFADAGTEFPGNNGSKLAIQLQLAAASGTSTAPATTVLNVDDVWLE